MQARPDQSKISTLASSQTVGLAFNIDTGFGLKLKLIDLALIHSRLGKSEWQLTHCLLYKKQSVSHNG